MEKQELEKLLRKRITETYELQNRPKPPRSHSLFSCDKITGKYCIVDSNEPAYNTNTESPTCKPRSFQSENLDSPVSRLRGYVLFNSPRLLRQLSSPVTGMLDSPILSATVRRANLSNEFSPFKSSTPTDRVVTQERHLLDLTPPVEMRGFPVLVPVLENRENEETQGGEFLSYSCVVDHSKGEKDGRTEEKVQNNSSEEDLQWGMDLLRIAKQQVPHDSLEAEMSQVRSLFLFIYSCLA